MSSNRIAIPFVLIMLSVASSLSAQTSEDFFNDAILHEIRLDIHPSDWQILRTNFLSNDYYDCNFRWRYQGRDIALESVAIRSRGGGSRNAAKPGLRVD